MTYQVGISSGWWYIGRDPNLLGLATKAGSFGATAGVTFNQIDLETMSEFLEPKVKENIKRVQKELGLKLGFHGEIGELAALESGERRIWEQAHIRLVETVKYAADFGIVYINLHTSSTIIVQFEEARIRPFGFQYQVVSPEGEPFWKFADRSEPAKDYIKRIILPPSHISSQIRQEEPFRRLVRELNRRYSEIQKRREEEEIKKLRQSEEYRASAPAQQRLAEERVRMAVQREVRQDLENEFERISSDPNVLYDAWKESPFAKYVLEAGEIDAYLTVAHHMQGTGDPLWSAIVGSKDPHDAYINMEKEFNAAVAARYIEGHLRVKDHPANKSLLNGMSVVEWLEKTGVVLCFELPEVERGQRHAEGLYRLYQPIHSYHFIKKINSPRVRITIDFEHMLAQKLDPYKIIPQLPDDFGRLVFLFHLGEPKPYWGTAHIPIPLGSQAQEIIYEWLYMLRKKGFRNGILIFERGSGRGGGKTPFEVFEQSVLSLRQIAEFLDKDTNPRELPLEFYGLSERNEAVYARELVAIREHKDDPLEGVLAVPEEKHTFLSARAVEKGKGKEWEARKFR